MDEKEVVEEKEVEKTKLRRKKEKTEIILISMIMSILVFCAAASACWSFGREVKRQYIFYPGYVVVDIKYEYIQEFSNEEFSIADFGNYSKIEELQYWSKAWNNKCIFIKLKSDCDFDTIVAYCVIKSLDLYFADNVRFTTYRELFG